MALPFLQGCGRGNSSSSPEGKKMEMRYAVNLTLEEHDGYTLGRVRIPVLCVASALRGVCDAQYFTKQPIAEGLQSGRIADCGSSSAPNVERMLMLKPDAVFISPFENSGT